MAHSPLPIDRIENATGAMAGLMSLLGSQPALVECPSWGLYCLLDLIHCELQVALVEMEVMQAALRAAKD